MEATCTKQLLYEIHNPAEYITPDCIADFSKVNFEEIEKNKILVRGGSGGRKTDTLKVSVGYMDGYMSISGMSYGGVKCFERARLAEEIVRKRLDHFGIKTEELRIDLIEINSLFPKTENELKNEISEVRLRVAARTLDKETTIYIANEVESLVIHGPAGGGGLEKSIREVIAIESILVPREDVKVNQIYMEV